MSDQIPDRHTPILAWRVWQVSLDESAPLVSVTQQHMRWVPYEKHEAKCLCSIQVPGPHHTCGIHAAKTLEAVIAYYQGCGIGIHTVAYAIGRVRLWGRVIVHYQNGIYRAQNAYPDAFVYDARLNLAGRALAEWLAKAYGVTAEKVELPITPIMPQPQWVWPQPNPQPNPFLPPNYVPPPPQPMIPQYLPPNYWPTVPSTTTSGSGWGGANGGLGGNWDVGSSGNVYSTLTGGSSLSGTVTVFGITI